MGLSLLEILLAIVIVAAILAALIPLQLKNANEKLIDKTVGQMTALTLAARNYYQDQRPTASINATAWPQTLLQLTNSNYLPPASLCSPWPLDPNARTNKAANNNADCGNHEEYALFPANTNGVYDTTLPGIRRTSLFNDNILNTGGSFWGVSLTLPTQAAARAVQERLPFATLCSPSGLITQLNNGNVPCAASSQESKTVTVLVPRPATWPNDKQYAKDGLIQTMGTVVICNSLNASSPTCNTSNNNSATISIPNSCGNDENGHRLIPALFIYPFGNDFNSGWLGVNKPSAQYTGIEIAVARNTDTWTVYAGMAGSSTYNPTNLNAIVLAYFTVCAPNSTSASGHSGTTTTWDASYFGPRADNGYNYR